MLYKETREFSLTTTDEVDFSQDLERDELSSTEDLEEDEIAQSVQDEV